LIDHATIMDTVTIFNTGDHHERKRPPKPKARPRPDYSL
jgi:hypothetical protein